MSAFSFGGQTIRRPGILVRSSFGAHRVLQLLPFGTTAWVGQAEGGKPNTAYDFDDADAAIRILRKGPLVDAIKDAGAIGSASGLKCVVVGAKTPGQLALTSGGNPAATLFSGDDGLYVNDTMQYSAVAGTATGQAVTFVWTDAEGNQFVYGGPKTRFDNLASYSDLQAAMLADPLLTPPLATGLPPIFTLTISADGPIDNLAVTNLGGGSGAPGDPLIFNDWRAAIDVLVNVPFDIGHLVKCYDLAAQAYADGQAQQVSPLGRLRRFWHQAAVTGTDPAHTKVVNSAAVAASLIATCEAINSPRSSACAQRIRVTDPKTGVQRYQDLAVLMVGLSAFLGAKGANGPATPLTFEIIPTGVDIDFDVLDTGTDLDDIIKAGGTVVERVGRVGTIGSVRVVQSLTTAPNDANGDPWPFAEFSVMRVSDALLANVKAQVETRQHGKVIGGGNTLKTMASVIADVVDILEAAFDNQWITAYDPKSIEIHPTGTSGTDDIVRYSAAPTYPLNHLGIDQTLLPFEVIAQQIAA